MKWIARTLVVACAMAAGARVQAQVKTGDKAPAIEAMDQDGNAWSLEKRLGGKHLVVYFYPAAMTGGCTKQACAYRDQVKAGGQRFDVVGISADPVENLKAFQQAEQLNFTLLSDPDGRIAKAYGVPVTAGEKSIKRTVGGREVEFKRSSTTARWTFVIDPQGKIAHVEQDAKPVADLANVLELLGKAE